jgi:hypothetical protein
VEVEHDLRFEDGIRWLRSFDDTAVVRCIASGYLTVTVGKATGARVADWIEQL